MHKPTSYIQQTRDLYDSLGYPPYRWYEADSKPPFVRPAKPLAELRVGMISTAGTYVAGQVAYHYKDDTSIRVIPANTPINKLRFSHVTENYLPNARRDPRCVFPAEALPALVEEGVIGGLADTHLSCMGGIYSQRRVHQELIPNLEDELPEIDALLLVPL
ncbi:MAG: hypothetical protein CMQ29_01185 [Gammaproteobacteria bacterium]|jgi:D-proline reductase (dithiol) PrdB|nr:hypothetical protein [Gammaproteobacteria bacterium]